MAQPSQVLVSSHLADFFREEVVAARTALNVEMTELNEFYLVHLLCDFTRPDRRAQPGAEPLAFIYQRASEADPGARVAILKELGDVALYVAGFFADSIERSLVDVDYYVQMGGGAYQDLAALLGAHRQGETFAQLYNQMAHNFTDMVDVLGQIAVRSQGGTARDGDLLKLYDRYARTGSTRIRKLLLAQGLLPGTASTVPLDYIQ